MTIASTCGQLILGGFSGLSLPDHYARALAAGSRSGAIVFARNLDGSVEQAAALSRQVHAAAPRPLFAVDQEGGRVARLRAPFLEVPAMRLIGALGDEGFAERVASAVGAELAAIGITIDFAPVLDVDTRADNPVIGDRAFGADAATCARLGTAWIRGLQGAGVLATGKHFPGHGDTSADSHVELPVVNQPRDRLEGVELAPFRAAAAAGVAAMMTAHVVYTALDTDRPATLSPAILSVLRDPIGFGGMIVSDDLEMKAVAARWSIGDAAVQAIAAGCDLLLICQSFEAQEVALAALVAEAERSPTFAACCRTAAERVRATRSRATARPLDSGDLAAAIHGPQSQAVAAEIRARTRP